MLGCPACGSLITGQHAPGCTWEARDPKRSSPDLNPAPGSFLGKFQATSQPVWALPPGDTYFAKILEQTPEGFELDHLEFALRYVKRFDVAIDGGAHIGTWSVAMSKRFKKVFAFEPSLDNYLCLRQNARRWAENIIVRHAALGASAGLCTVESDPLRQGNSGARIVVPGARVPMEAIDGFELAGVDFLKLDVEGYEAEALKGATRTLRRYRPTVMIECKAFNPPRHGGPPAAIKILADLGYTEVGGVRNDRVFVHASAG